MGDRVIPKLNNNGYVIAVAFTGHNASVTIAKGDEVLEVFEFERFFNLKNLDFSDKDWKDSNNEYTKWNNERIYAYLGEVQRYLSKKYTNEFDLGIFVDRLALPGFDVQLDKFFKVKNNNWFRESHHLSHGAGAFYQSSFKKALVFTIDGGSIDGCTTAGIYERGKPVEWLEVKSNALGRAYFRFGRLIEEIRFSEHGQSATYPGKLMGLAGYGTPDIKLAKLLKPLYEYNDFDKIPLTDEQKEKLAELERTYSKKFSFIKSFNNRLNRIRLKGEDAYTLAASAQLAFEDVALDVMMPLIKQYPELPICISGGCGLNILFNTRLAKEFEKQVFVPPDPTDCGLSFGAMLNYLKPDSPIDDPYLGPELLDQNMLGTYLYEEIGINNPKYSIRTNVKASDLTDIILNSKIIGVCQGRSERGPRALGNRSIICTVQNPNMKDIINANVKHREWYRPFSPIVRLEDVSKFFEWEGESRFMTFSPKVLEEYKDKIKPVVHVDGTARVQTITKEQNPFIYDLLTELHNKTDIGMILNTSFNVDGKPIVSSIRDAIKVLKDTDLDGIYIEGTLILKNV